MEVAQSTLVCAPEEVDFYCFFSTTYQPECRRDGSARAAILGHEMETAGKSLGH